MPTLSQLKKRVYSVVRDSEKVFIEDSDVEDWINDAQLDLTARLQLNQQEVTGTTSAGGLVTLPTGYLTTIWFSVLEDSTAARQTIVEFVNDVVYDSWRLSPSTPANTLGRIFDGSIETYPVVVSQAYTLRYILAPTELNSSADIPDIPVELHLRLVNYARGQAKYAEGELSEGDRYMGMYEAGLPAPPTSVSRNIPGPLNLVPAPSIFDWTVS